jgi:uncharacterized protein YhhL (DUF1145 family)
MANQSRENAIVQVTIFGVFHLASWSASWTNQKTYLAPHCT